jgi:hypothetical protein
MVNAIRAGWKSQIESLASLRSRPWCLVLGAWCSNLTAAYLIIVIHGPLPPLATTSKCCSAARHCGHSCSLQHFVG